MRQATLKKRIDELAAPIADELTESKAAAAAAANGSIAGRPDGAAGEQPGSVLQNLDFDLVAEVRVHLLVSQISPVLTHLFLTAAVCLSPSFPVGMANYSNSISVVSL